MYALVANLLVLLPPAVGLAIYAADANVYYTASQEDGLLEWSTFWLFVAAAGRYGQHALRDRRRRGGVPWFAAGLFLFCLVVALEEISWGQRLVGYRPPAYFLEANYQQEFNLHNVIATDLRMLAMQLVLVGYGVVVASLSLLAPVRHAFDRLRIVAPPPALVPAFAVLGAAYASYPVDYTGEWIECAMGIAFLGSAIAAEPARSPRTLAFAATGALAAAGATLVLADSVRGSDAERIAAARAEVAALARDFETPKLHTRCGIHKRLYTFVREYGQAYVLRGEFAALVQASDGPVRAGYLLDPWNSPYWLRHECDDGREARFVYSFGPNRQRDSDEWEVKGDDIGASFDK